MRSLSALVLLALVAGADEKPPAVDLGKVLRESKEFQAKCRKFHVSFEPGIARATGEIFYRGGGPCEYLVGVFPAKAHETIVLLDDGPWKGEGRRPRAPIRGLAEVLNNAMLAAGFRKGSPFDWDDETREVFAPKGETVHVYAEWADEQGKARRARMADWLWNFKTIDPMEPGKFVYTGSMIIDEGPPDHKKWLGAEVDGLVVAVLNTSTALIDSTEEGSRDNGVYEAIPIRIPEAGARVTVAFSKRPLDVTEKYPPLKLPKELQERKKELEAEKARAKAEAEKKKAK